MVNSGNSGKDRGIEMKWISVNEKSPDCNILGGSEILVLVNSKIYICEVLEKGTIYITDNRFLYSSFYGWAGDPRFAKPTHWMPLPEVPKDVQR